MGIIFSGVAFAENNVGSMVAVKGKALIERDKKAVEAKVKDSIFLNDTVTTLEASRAKMLFTDDSVLTLGEKSKAVIREFVYSKDKGGQSIFNLIDGKMRSVVGKTKFEVHTPTAVAAARGTVILFETGIKDGKKFTTIICLEGETFIRSVYSGIVGTITLKPGMMVTIFDGEPLPEQIVAPPSEVERLSGATELIHEVSVPGPAEVMMGPGWMTIEQMPPALPPVINQPPPIPTPTTPVNIDIIFP